MTGKRIIQFPTTLSPREKQVYDAVIAGYITRQMIAARIGISAYQASHYLRLLMERGMVKRTAPSQYAVRDAGISHVVAAEARSLLSPIPLSRLMARRA